LVAELGLEPEFSRKLVEGASQEAKALAAESERKQAEKELAQQTNGLAVPEKEQEE